jgi:hypothetical protein
MILISCRTRVAVSIGASGVFIKVSVLGIAGKIGANHTVPRAHRKRWAASQRNHRSGR